MYVCMDVWMWTVLHAKGKVSEGARGEGKREGEREREGERGREREREREREGEGERGRGREREMQKRGAPICMSVGPSVLVIVLVSRPGCRWFPGQRNHP